jgi:hypothetical protein
MPDFLLEDGMGPQRPPLSAIYNSEVEGLYRFMVNMEGTATAIRTGFRGRFLGTAVGNALHIIETDAALMRARLLRTRVVWC